MAVIERLEDLDLFNLGLKSCPVLVVNFQMHQTFSKRYSPVSTEDGEGKMIDPLRQESQSVVRGWIDAGTPSQFL